MAEECSKTKDVERGCAKEISQLKVGPIVKAINQAGFKLGNRPYYSNGIVYMNFENQKTKEGMRVEIGDLDIFEEI